MSLNKCNVNYLFFLCYGAFITLLHVFHVFLIETSPSISTWFFLIDTVAQCLLETCALLIIAWLLQSHMPRLVMVYALSVFFLMLSHVIDFPLVRLMDLSFWGALGFVVKDTYANFLELLLASNVSLAVWLCALVFSLFLCLSGILFFRWTARWVNKRSYRLEGRQLLCVTGVMSLFLVTWDYSMQKRVDSAVFDRYQKTLPWKYTLLQSAPAHLPLAAPLRDVASQEELLSKLDSRIFSPVRRPDIYLFIVESLREDFICKEVAPNLYAFKEEHVSFPLAFANANGTHLSWYSLLHSQFPLYWNRPQSHGSLPLLLLKKMGYEIQVFSSARLTYYQMDRILFGKDMHLIDGLHCAEGADALSPYQRDCKSMDLLFHHMSKQDSGRLFIVFLDATHLDYSWPKHKSQFFPFDDKINYLTAVCSGSNLERIKNRYRNALYSVDALFGTFFSKLNQSPGGKQAVVVVTADHGEEFYEQGNLFHASSLTHPQIHIPLYYRFGQDHVPQLQCQMTCHMDVFPSLFHYLFNEDLMQGILQGESIFNTIRWPYTLVGRFNASQSPEQFCLHNSQQKLILEFEDVSEMFQSKALTIRGVKTIHDQPLPIDLQEIEEVFSPGINRLFAP